MLKNGDKNFSPDNKVLLNNRFYVATLRQYSRVNA
jgi:hypothetical protein